MESPLFSQEDLIYSYTEEEAQEDGFLIQLFSGNNLITNAAFQELKEYYKKQYSEYSRIYRESDAQCLRTYNKQYSEYSNFDFLSFFHNEILILEPFAKKEYAKGGILSTNFKFKVGKFKHSQILWFIPNEKGGITVMLPGDY